MGDTLKSLSESPFYAPVGIVLASGAWWGLRHLLRKVESINGAELLHSALALIFSGLYIYFWTQEGNPHVGELKETDPLLHEVPLLLAGGVYASALLPMASILSALHSLISTVSAVIIVFAKTGGNLGVVYAFLYHFPTLIKSLVLFLKSRSIEGLAKLLSWVYVLLFLGSIGLMFYNTYLVIDGGAPLLAQGLAVVYPLVCLTALWESKGLLFASAPVKRRRGGGCKNRSRSTSKRRSRSRAKPVKKC